MKMNFSQYLKCNRQTLSESTEWPHHKVALCVGRFSPLHLGYLQQIKDVIIESANNEYESILVILDPHKLIDPQGPIISSLKECFPSLRVLISSDLLETLQKFRSFGRVPVFAACEAGISSSVTECVKSVYGDTTYKCEQRIYYQHRGAKLMTEAIKQKDYAQFIASCLVSEASQTEQLFEYYTVGAA